VGIVPGVAALLGEADEDVVVGPVRGPTGNDGVQSMAGGWGGGVQVFNEGKGENPAPRLQGGSMTCTPPAVTGARQESSGPTGRACRQYGTGSERHDLH